MAASRGRKRRERGAVDQLPSGAYRVRVYAGVDPVTKRRHNLIETIPAGPRAQKLAEEARVRLLNQVYERRNPRTSATVKQLLDRYLAEADLEFNTRDVYRGYADKHIVPLLGEQKVGSLDAGVMDSFYTELRRCRDHCAGGKGLIDHRTKRKHACDERCRPHQCRPLAASTIRQIHFILYGAVRRAIRWKWLASNPIADAEPPAQPKSNPKPPTSEQAARIINESFKDPDWGTLVWLTMVTGHRRGELCGIRWRHLELDHAVLHLEKAIGQRGRKTWEKDTKSHQDRRITLDPDTVQLLLEHRERWRSRAAALGVTLTDDSFVFSLAPDGSTHLLPDSVTQRYRNLARRLGINSSIHKLRHYSATELIAAGVDVRTVAGRLGHGGGGTTTLRAYTAWVSEADQRAAGNLAARMPQRPVRVPVLQIPDIEPTSPYEIVAVRLRDKILDGSLPAGMSVPPVKSLALEHGVSASTALRAVRLLDQWGLVEVYNGRPTRVRPLGPLAAPGDVPDPQLAAIAVVPSRSQVEPLDLELRHLGDVVSTFRAEFDPADSTELKQLLSDAIRRSGGDGAAIGEYELVVHYAGERGIVTTFVATSSA